MRNQATQIVRQYVNTLKPSDTLSIDTIKRSIRDISMQILDIEIYRFTIKDKPMLSVNQTSAWNERFVEAENSNAILIT